MVDLPDADSPVSQIVKPFCLRSAKRSARESDGCQVMLLSKRGGVGIVGEGERV